MIAKIAHVQNAFSAKAAYCASALERPHPALRNTKQRRRPARQQAPPAATAPLAARPTTHPTCPQSSTARVSGRSTAAERHAGSRTVHFDVPDLELRGDRGTPFEGLVHRVHSDVKLSVFLLAALRAIAWRNSPALALAGAEIGVSACVRDPYLQVAPRARVAFVAGLSALRRVLVAAAFLADALVAPRAVICPALSVSASCAYEATGDLCAHRAACRFEALAPSTSGSPHAAGTGRTPPRAGISPAVKRGRGLRRAQPRRSAAAAQRRGWASVPPGTRR